MGPLFQVAMMGDDSYRLTLAASGGTEIVPALLSASGELGATQRFGVAPGFGIHTGVVAAPTFLTVAWRSEWLLDETSVAGGVRIPPQYGLPNTTACTSIGRPLHTSAAAAVVRPCRLGARRPDRGPSRSRSETAGRRWQRDAMYECASVPAFLQLAAELLAHRAPAALVDRALDAARDEMVHAVLCADLASRHLRTRVWPQVPEEDTRPPIPGLPGLVRLAAESWLDGCLSEGVAAARAARAVNLATDPETRAVTRRIAIDEHRHAELGWSILAWTARRAGDAARDTVCALRNADIEAEPDTDGDLEHHGCLGASKSALVAERHAARCRRRLDSLL